MCFYLPFHKESIKHPSKSRIEYLLDLICFSYQNNQALFFDFSDQLSTVSVLNEMSVIVISQWNYLLYSRTENLFLFLLSILSETNHKLKQVKE